MRVPTLPARRAPRGAGTPHPGRGREGMLDAECRMLNGASRRECVLPADAFAPRSRPLRSFLNAGCKGLWSGGDGHAEEAGAGGGGGGGIDGAPAVGGGERVAPPERVGAGGAEVGRPADARLAVLEVDRDDEVVARRVVRVEPREPARPEGAAVRADEPRRGGEGPGSVREKRRVRRGEVGQVGRAVIRLAGRVPGARGDDAARVGLDRGGPAQVGRVDVVRVLGDDRLPVEPYRALDAPRRVIASEIRIAGPVVGVAAARVVAVDVVGERAGRAFRGGPW